MTAADLATAVLPAVIDRRYSQIRGYLAEQGVGFHPLALGSFLKSELVK